MIGTRGPFQIIETHLSALADQPPEPPRRRYSCRNYQSCLNLAAALNWDNFTCRGCCGDIDETLYWRVYQAMKKDLVAAKICDVPTLRSHVVESKPESSLKVANKS